MKVVNVDQKIIVPISDETKGLTYEMQMTLGELLKETLEEQVETIEASPVAWLREKAQKPCMTSANPFDYALTEWQREQEAKA